MEAKLHEYGIDKVRYHGGDLEGMYTGRLYTILKIYTHLLLKRLMQLLKTRINKNKFQNIQNVTLNYMHALIHSFDC